MAGQSFMECEYQVEKNKCFSWSLVNFWSFLCRTKYNLLLNKPLHVHRNHLMYAKYDF
jgi:hypothetical protein